MKKIIKILIFVLVLVIISAPALSFASGPTSSPLHLVPCTNTPTINSDGTVTYASKCDFNALIALINNVINFIIFLMALPIVAIMFVYAGFELITSGGNTEKRSTAKKIFFNAVLGFVISIACWIIVETVFNVLGYKGGSWIGF